MSFQRLHPVTCALVGLRVTAVLLTGGSLAACDASESPETFALSRTRGTVSAAPGEGDVAGLTDAWRADADEPLPDAADAGDAAGAAEDALADGAVEVGPEDATAPPDDGGGDTAEPPRDPIGTFEDPFVASAWPYVRRHDTRGAPSNRVDRYDCAATTSEAGPERVYRLEIAAAGTLVAEVLEATGVDVDLHLLEAPPAPGARTSACLTRANTRLVQAVTPGTRWLVVDSYQKADGAILAGAYTLGVELEVLDAWQVNQLSEGLTWKKKVYSNYASGRQTINALEVDLTRFEVRPHYTGSCRRTSTVAAGIGALAAINGGFFDMSAGNCPALDLVKVAGVLKTPNSLTGSPQRCFGVDEAQNAMWRWVPAGQDWPEAWHALGAYPNLVTSGSIDISPERTSNFFVGRHNRTALGVTAAGRVLLVTVDGRTTAGRGMTMRELAQHMVSLGAVEAVNLDGGGSTTMWIPDGSVNGVVNYPSDDGTADHFGERAVSDIVVVLPR